ncbi:MAG: MobA/MobL family protein [Patescibacteria group bacterium]|jgi:hypothetical protein
MASAHFRIKSGTKAKSSASAHSQYIMREGKFEVDKKDIENIGYSNLPEWANKPSEFWQASDYYERANGRVYSEMEIALPNELSPEKRLELVNEFCEQQFGKENTYSFAIHNTDSALKKNVKNAHVHIMFCERKLDNIYREKENFFKRYNDKKPELGGTKKDRKWTNIKMPKIVRKQCFDLQNKYLLEIGAEKLLDHRTLLEQRIEALQNGDITKAEKLDREPEVKLGPNAHRLKREVIEIKRNVSTKDEYEKKKEEYYEKQKPDVKLAYYIRLSNRIETKLDGLEKEINKQEIEIIGPNKNHKNYYLAKRKMNNFKRQLSQLNYEKEKLENKIITPGRALIMAKSIYEKRLTNKNMVFVDNENSRNQIKKIADGILKKDEKYRNLYFAIKTGIGKTNEKIAEYEKRIEFYGKEISAEKKHILEKQATKGSRHKSQEGSGHLSANLDLDDDISKSVKDFSQIKDY